MDRRSAHAVSTHRTGHGSQAGARFDASASNRPSLFCRAHDMGSALLVSKSLCTCAPVDWAVLTSRVDVESFGPSGARRVGSGDVRCHAPSSRSRRASINTSSRMQCRARWQERILTSFGLAGAKKKRASPRTLHRSLRCNAHWRVQRASQHAVGTTLRWLFTDCASRLADRLHVVERLIGDRWRWLLTRSSSSAL